MATTPFRQSIVWLVIVVALLLGVVAGWRISERRSLQSRWNRGHEAMKKGAVEMQKSFGSPKEAMEKVGGPFAPQRRGEQGTPGKEKSR